MNPSDFLYIKAIRRQPLERTPIWMMRQAGRYLPEYRALRAKHDFLTMCKTPELAAEITLQPVRRFGLDAAILFSDILVIPEAMGQTLTFRENEGPRLEAPLRSEADLQNLTLNGLEEKLNYVARAVRLIRSELNGRTPLIGFSGSPFTLATYMVEGKPSKNFRFIKELVFRQPQFLKTVLSILSEAVVRYLQMQIDAGAQAIQIFDTWGGILPPPLFMEFSGKWMSQIVEKLKPGGVPVTLFSKGGIAPFRLLLDSGADVLGVDWMTDVKEAKKLARGSVALQGNLDPTALYGSPEIIKEEVRTILETFAGQSGHVFNLGHGILPDIPLDNVYYLVEQVREISSRLKSK